jgi:hypothetical protein
MLWKPYHGFNFDADPDGNGGSGQGAEKTPAEKALDGLLGRMGDANKVALHLLEENYGHRQTIRELKAKQIPEGSVTITADEKALLETYKALGEPKAIESERAETSRLRSEQVHTTAAAAHGFKPSVLSRLLNGEKIEIRQETVDGKSVDYAVVLQDGKEAVRLDQYASTAWADFLPALTASATDTAGQGAGAQSPTSQGGVVLTRQQRGQEPGKDDIVSKRLAAQQEARAKAKNPLMRE